MSEELKEKGANVEGTEDATINAGVSEVPDPPAEKLDASSESPDPIEPKAPSEDALSDEADPDPADDGAADLAALRAEVEREQAKLDAKVTELRQMSEQLDEYKAVIEQRNEADLSGLSDEDKALVAAIAGEDPLKVSSTISALQKANKIGKPSPPPTDQSRTAGGKKPSDKPKDWKDADRRFKAKVHGQSLDLRAN